MTNSELARKAHEALDSACEWNYIYGSDGQTEGKRISEMEEATAHAAIDALAEALAALEQRVKQDEADRELNQQFDSVIEAFPPQWWLHRVRGGNK